MMGSLPKSTKKKIPRSVHEMSKEMLQETLKKKKQCNTKALEIVEKLCETNVDESWFLENLQFINQCHFDDIIIERSISKICGYSLCDKQLKNVPAQQYHISTRYNKVFDITERKNFCSSSCYKSAIHVKKQLFTSPLWFRDQEVIPKYTILESSKSSMGEEIVLLPDKIKLDPEDEKETNMFKKSDVLDKDLKDLEKQYSNIKINDSSKGLNIKQCRDEKSNINNEVDKEEKIDVKVNIYEKNSNLGKEENKKDENLEFNKSSDLQHHIDKNKISSDQLEKYKKTKGKSKSEKKNVDTIPKVEKSIYEWFSLDTYFYLFGEEKLKELFFDKADEIKQVLNSKLSMASHRDKIDRMIQLYGLLDTGSFSKKEIKTKLKPLPDYSVLKEEINSVEVKVRAFYQGQMEVTKPSAENTEDKKEENKESNVDDEVIYLPLVDAHAQIPHRRKIILDKLNKVLPDLINILGSDYVLQMNEVRSLVATFMLGPHNITFKPTEWYLIGIVVLKLLSLKDSQLESVIKMESSESQISLILESFNLQNNYLDNLVFKLTDNKNLVKKLNEINS